MRLLVTTPVSVIVDAENVHYVRAEDETGAFGILPGHAEFITALAVSVITWREESGMEHHIAVNGGVLTVRGGAFVEVASRQAIGEDTFGKLGEAVLKRFHEEARAEQEARTGATRLHLATIRMLQRYLEAGRQQLPRGILPTGRVPAARGEPAERGEMS